jgi:hypothetical protein
VYPSSDKAVNPPSMARRSASPRSQSSHVPQANRSQISMSCVMSMCWVLAGASSRRLRGRRRTADH